MSLSATWVSNDSVVRIIPPRIAFLRRKSCGVFAWLHFVQNHCRIMWIFWLVVERISWGDIDIICAHTYVHTKGPRLKFLMGTFLVPSFEIFRKGVKGPTRAVQYEVKEARGMTRGLGNKDCWAKFRVYRDYSKDRESTYNLGKFTLRHCWTSEEHLRVILAYESAACQLTPKFHTSLIFGFSPLSPKTHRRRCPSHGLNRRSLPRDAATSTSEDAVVASRFEPSPLPPHCARVRSPLSSLASATFEWVDMEKERYTSHSLGSGGGGAMAVWFQSHSAGL